MTSGFCSDWLAFRSQMFEEREGGATRIAVRPQTENLGFVPWNGISRLWCWLKKSCPRRTSEQRASKTESFTPSYFTSLYCSATKQHPRVILEKLVDANDILLWDFTIDHWYSRATEADMKLSELPVSIKAWSLTPLTNTLIKALDKQEGAVAIVREVSDALVECVGFGKNFDRHTFWKWPRFPQALQMASLAGHFMRGCLWLPQK